MNSTFAQALLWLAAVGCGLMGGIYFAFSTFILRAFDSLGPAQASAAMNAINVVILRSPFMPLFWLTTLASLALVVLAVWSLQSAPTRIVLASALVYVLGMFVCTVVFNVPLNDQLAAAAGDSDMWRRYLADWTRWNHVRTLASTLACTGFVWALIRLR